MKQTIHPRLPREFRAITTVKLRTPLLPTYKYRIRFFIQSEIPISWKSTTRDYPVQLFPSNLYADSDISIQSDMVKSSTILPKFTVGKDAALTGKKYFEFIVEPDTSYTYLTIGLGNPFYTSPRYDIQSSLDAKGVYVELIKDVEQIKIDTATATLAGRQLVSKGINYTLTDSLVTIELYDHKKVDGDIVSIYLNDTLIVEKEVLSKDKKSFQFTLDKKQSSIVLHAENLGSEPPNTAAIIIKTKNESFSETLSSTLHKSEYFNLILETP